MTATPKLQRTTNYTRFTANATQRSISKTNVSRLAKYMKKDGFNPSKPLTVVKEGRQLVLIDGHHRLEAAKLADEPVYFVQVHQNGIIPLNVLQKQWNGNDYLMHYVRAGCTEYIKLYNLIEKYKLGLSLTIGLASGKKAHSVTHSFRDGSYRVESPSVVQQVSHFASVFRETCKTAPTRGLLTAYSRCLDLQKFNPDRMLQSLKTYGADLLTKQSGVDACLSQLEELYNHKRRKGNLPLAFLARGKDNS